MVLTTARAQCSHAKIESIMKISAVQIQSAAGDIASNLTRHVEFGAIAIAQGADLVFFPELSLTGYEPQLARSLAMSSNDSRLDIFQQQSDAHNVIVGVGLPIAVGTQVQIGMVWFMPQAPRLHYAKQQLHADELPFFVTGDQPLVLTTATHKLAPAICYESLQPDHAADAASRGADVYLASVAKPARGMAKGMQHYPAIARQHQMYVIVSNAVGPCDDFISVGQSAAWSDRGELLAQMDITLEGILTLDTSSGIACIHRLQTVSSG